MAIMACLDDKVDQEAHCVDQVGLEVGVLLLPHLLRVDREGWGGQGQGASLS